MKVSIRNKKIIFFVFLLLSFLGLNSCKSQTQIQKNKENLYEILDDLIEISNFQIGDFLEIELDKACKKDATFLVRKHFILYSSTLEKSVRFLIIKEF